MAFKGLFPISVGDFKVLPLTTFSPGEILRNNHLFITPLFEVKETYHG